ncbi:MAG: hypothetical protein EZS28_011940 [Streblomastix strix]|uniref:Uncharacterized protein n=1 Tax=Streblomastix strix TaxID=222440 RepID=A0A5J4WCY5_9EUKA|nr:MAG: hypothetical protein EZS28_011940 [Streblomastix strix]
MLNSLALEISLMKEQDDYVKGDELESDNCEDESYFNSDNGRLNDQDYYASLLDIVSESVLALLSEF